MTRITIEHINVYATFVAPDGTICKSEVMHDFMNEYDYVADGNGETWLMEEVHILRIESITQTEVLEMDDLIEIDD